MRRLEINAILFLALVFGLGVANGLDTTDLKVSEVERRTLRAMPTFSIAGLANGQFLKAYEDYFSDTFILRERLVVAAMALKGLAQTQAKGARLVAYSGDNSANLKQAKTSPARSKVAQNGMLIVGGRAMSVHHFDAGAARYYAKAVNAVASAVGDKVKVELLLVPSAAAFYAGEAFSALTSPQEATASYVHGLLSPSVAPIDTLSALRKHASEYIYFRTDHHWTALAAYYAYAELMQATNRAPVALSRYKQSKLEGFLGSSYTATLDTVLKENPDTVNLYLPYVDYVYTIDGFQKPLLDLAAGARDKNKYGVFMCGDHPIGLIKTQAKNGRTLLVIKDSNGNAFIPFLLPHYREIIAVDPRTCWRKLTDLVRTHGVTEVLVLNGMGASTARAYADLIYGLLAHGAPTSE